MYLIEDAVKMSILPGIRTPGVLTDCWDTLDDDCADSCIPSGTRLQHNGLALHVQAISRQTVVSLNSAITGK